jgi:two-component system, sensor histidine kinase and response regulator
MLESAPDGIVVVDRQGAIVYFNARAESLFGYERGEVLGSRIEMLLAADAGDQHRRQRARYTVDSQARGIGSGLELTARRKDGSEFPAEVSLSPLRTDAEILISSAIRDVSERRKLERAAAHMGAELMRARSDIDHFFSLSLDLMAIANEDGRFIRVNPAFERTLGYSSGELTSRPLAEFVHPEDVEATIAVRAEQAEGRALVGFENRFRCKDGTYRWLRWTATAIEAGLSYETGRDVTDRNRMEDELRASREQALDSSRLKSEFVANMSHEIRTPLNGVVCMSELLLDTSLTPEQREYTEVLLTSADALMHVINDILDFSKIEAGKLEISAEDFSIETALSEVCAIVGAKAHEKRLELAVSIDGEVPGSLRGDAYRVRQVLSNLLGNAIKFTSHGEIVVRVGLEGDLVGSERLRIEVVDTGIGIGAEQQRNLFQPFSQGDATTTRRFEGSGLGLCIAKQLVELMGGKIGVRSVPGEGSTFWFTLPCERGNEFEAELPVKDLTGTRVLIVDDNATNRSILEQQTARWGMSPDSAEGGHAALELLRRAAASGRPYEVAVIDMQMPDMDGLQLAHAIKANPRLRTTRLIMLSSSAVRKGEARAAGIDAELGKPVRQSRLYSQLVSLLDRSTRMASTDLRLQTAATAAPGRHVLVAEDNEINRFAAIRVLQKLGNTVDVAHDGREAIEMTAHTRYAAVFMDCQMPDIDGYTATATIRRRESGRVHTPIIAMTAYTMAGDRARCLAAGMDDYIAKPLRLERVAEICGRLPVFRASAPDSDELDMSLFDPTALFEIVDGDQAEELVRMFIDQLDAALSQLADVIARADPDELHQVAHRLKGSAATLGAPKLMDICEALCKMARSGSIEGASALHAELADVAAATSSTMRAYVQAQPTPS